MGGADVASEPVPVLSKVIELDGVQMTVRFRERSNPQAMSVLRGCLMAGMIRQMNAPEPVD